MSSVYALVSSEDITKVRYVGISRFNDPSVRLATHLENAANPNFDGYDRPLYRWIRKHQSNGKIVNCITLAYDISWDEACTLEIQKIKEFKDAGHDLLNITSGGEGSLGLSHTESTKEKMSESGKNRHKLLRARGLVWGKDLGPQDKTVPEVKDRILKMRSSGMSYRLIAIELNTLGITTYKGSIWYPSSIKNICDRFIK